MQRMLLKCSFKIRTGFNFRLYIEQQLLHGGIAMPFAYNIEGLQKWHAGFQHRGELARKQRDVLVRDTAAPLDGQLFYFEHPDDLTT